MSYHWPHLGYRTNDNPAAVPGVDILHIGSVDLCDAPGIPGRLDDPRLDGCFERVVAMGARFLTAGIGWDLMLGAARQRVQVLRQLEER